MVLCTNTYGRKTFYAIIVLSILVSCKERYDPDIEFTDTGFLVTEGYINIGTNVVTSIVLSRTTPIDKSREKISETGASVSIENSLGESFQLHETESGTYISDSLTLPAQETYRIRILIGDKTYFSEFVTPIITPEIDSVSWSVQPGGAVDIGVSTHDYTDKTKHYQWEFDEVWEIQSEGYSLYEYNQGDWILRTTDEIQNRHTCWSYLSMNGLNIFSTNRLTQSIVLNRLVKSIPFNDPRLDVRYSIRVKQHALSDKAYNYIQLMLSNSENLGTFYDPMPGELNGNIFCTSTSETVVGVIEAYSTTHKRIFIHRDDVPNWDYETGCQDTLVSLESPDLDRLMRTNLLWKFHVTTPPGGGIGERDSVYIMPGPCLDCRLRKGTNLKPPFWDFGVDENDWTDK